MSAPIPTREPFELRAGVRYQWTKALGDYSYADGWRLTYYLRGTAELNIATTADTDGKGFSVDVTVAQTTALAAGDYSMLGLVVNGTDSRAVFSASVKVLVNLATTTAGHDGRTHAKKMLDALQQAQLTTGGNRILSYSIDGERSVTTLTPDQWRLEYAMWEDRVNWEKKREALNRGERVGVGIRFR